jgi:hypothetical protein
MPLIIPLLYYNKEILNNIIVSQSVIANLQLPTEVYYNIKKHVNMAKRP